MQYSFYRLQVDHHYSNQHEMKKARSSLKNTPLILNLGITKRTDDEKMDCAYCLYHDYYVFLRFRKNQSSRKPEIQSNGRNCC